MSLHMHNNQQQQVPKLPEHPSFAQVVDAVGYLVLPNIPVTVPQLTSMDLPVQPISTEPPSNQLQKGTGC